MSQLQHKIFYLCASLKIARLMKEEFTIAFSDLFADEGWERGHTVDLTHLEGTCCYCAQESEEEIRRQLKDIPAGAVHHIDGGDYHYLTLFFLEKISEPFQLLLLDNHPDDQVPLLGEGLLSCGSWVRNAKKLENLKLVVRNQKPSADLPVYVSLDLDFLDKSFARTNWDQGTASTEDAMALIPERILGADICGGITKSQGGGPEDFSINSATRRLFASFLAQRI